MDQKGEKQNNEEEEFDEEEEEEKEGDKKVENLNEKKEGIKEQKQEKIDETENKVDKQEEKEEKSQINIEPKNDKENINNNNKEKEELNNDNVNKEEMEEEEEEEMEEEDKKSTTTYMLKYNRKDNEPRESEYDKQLIKTKHCFFMIEFKILNSKKGKFLLIYCHEIAAIYFDEIYEKKYSIEDLYKENRHFRIFDEVVEAKNIIDEILKKNTKNTKKIFLDLKDGFFKLHLKITFFDKENEVIFNIPKKKITDKERIRILPDFLKEIQIKMNHLEEDNKKLKNGNKNLGENDKSDIFEGRRKSNSLGVDVNNFLGIKNNNNSSNTKKNKSNAKKRI
jgi:hypothetical protein